MNIAEALILEYSKGICFINDKEDWKIAILRVSMSTGLIDCIIKEDDNHYTFETFRLYYQDYISYKGTVYNISWTWENE